MPRVLGEWRTGARREEAAPGAREDGVAEGMGGPGCVGAVTVWPSGGARDVQTAEGHTTRVCVCVWPGR